MGAGRSRLPGCLTAAIRISRRSLCPEPGRRHAACRPGGMPARSCPGECTRTTPTNACWQEHFESARRWVDFIHGQNPNLLWINGRSNDYSDWLNGDTLMLEGYPKGISAVPKEVLATAFFAHSTDIVSKMAAVLGRQDEAARIPPIGRRYPRTPSNVRSSLPTAGSKATRRPATPWHCVSICWQSLCEPQATAHLLEAIDRYKGHPSTGIQTTHRMMLELTRNGHHDEACRLVHLRTVPSWGYTIAMGATTIWERWDGYVAGRGFQNPGMNSFNHWALGSVGEWIWRDIVGINPVEEHPGFEAFVVRPRPGPEITWAKGQYDSIQGRIVSDWRIDGGRFTLKLQVPPGTTATVYLPSSDLTAITEGGQPADQSPGVGPAKMENGNAVFQVDSGRYLFETPITEG